MTGTRWVWSVLSLAVVVAGDANLADAAGRPDVLGTTLEAGRAQRTPGARARIEGLDALEWDARVGLERAIGERSSAHRPRARGAHIALGDARIDRAGAHLGGVSIALASMGRGAVLESLDATASPHIAGPEVRITRAPGVMEWWRSLPSGLEQGVTLAERPASEGELVLTMSAGDGVRAELDGDAITLVGPDGRAVARYAQLSVLDADGARLPARLAVLDERIAIRIDDRRARYPVVIDPLVIAIEARLAPASGGAAEGVGTSVSLSADGTRALVGAPYRDGFRGSAYVFVRAGTTWTEEANLMASDRAPDDRFGVSVSLSGDGTGALVGASYENGQQGSAYVFRRIGTAWAQEGTPLVANIRRFTAYFGGSVALDGAGTRAAVGAAGDDGRGAAFFFVRSGSTWSLETRVPPGGFPPSPGDRYGSSVAISSDGTRALVGAAGTDGERGVVDAYVLAEIGGGVLTWGRITTLDAGPRTPGDRFGTSVAVAGDGSRALVGAMGRGAIDVFTWPSSSAVIHEVTLSAGGSIGASVSLSMDGTRAIAGAYDGGARTWTREGVAWTDEATLPPEGDFFGRSVSLAASGTRAIVGASGDGVALVYGIGLDGLACAAPEDCGSGFCVDGVCCNAACGDGAIDDCLGCNAALTGRASGTCAPLMATTVCRASVGACDLEERCDGASGACPSDALRPADTLCAPSSGGPCDLPDVCDGASGGCPARFMAADTVCLPSSGGVCDADDVCTGASGECLRRFHVGAECRASSGACDPAELCGSDPDCPRDQVAPAGTVCRASVDLVCDPLESCDGTSAACPADQRMCGVDGGPPPDSGGPVVTTPPATGCACRAAPRELGSLGSLGWLAALGLTWLTRRRALRCESRRLA
jgi:hypothetical protein